MDSKGIISTEMKEVSAVEIKYDVEYYCEYWDGKELHISPGWIYYIKE